MPDRQTQKKRAARRRPAACSDVDGIDESSIEVVQGSTIPSFFLL